MKIPLDYNKALDGEKKIMYAKDASGKFSKHQYGSKIEEFATEVAVQEYELLQQECLIDIEKGIASPIKYYMYANRMDINTLSSCAGIISFKVKRHLKMRHFKKLPTSILQCYANVFEITTAELKKTPNE